MKKLRFHYRARYMCIDAMILFKALESKKEVQILFGL